jgi:predicted membrane protein
MYLLMGEQQIIVPEGVEVEVTGFVFMGEKHVDVIGTRPRPGVPRLHIRVVGMMGEIKIRTA